MLYWALHQVWEQPNKTALICVAKLKFIPNVEYITAVESICPKLREVEAMELRSDVNVLLWKAKVPKPNLTRQENIGLAELKKDKDRIILTADKGVVMVIMHKEDYINKVWEY